MSAAPQRPSSRLALAAALAAATLLVYGRVAGLQFLHYDDDQYVTANPMVLAGLTWDGLAWAFTTFHFASWHPLTWLSHMLDVELFGPGPAAPHLVNALLHAANAALLLLTLARLTGAPWRSALVAALFALHPLHVESVAWVAERKDVLSTLLGLLALLAWVRYAERPGPGRYALVALALAGSLLAKPMWITAPALLLLLDGWPLRRVAGWPARAEADGGPLPQYAPSRLLLEKLPLLSLSIASAVVAMLAQRQGGAVQSLEQLGLAERLGQALIGYASYLGKTVWPVGLAAYYPLPAGGPSPWQVSAAAALLVMLTALAAWQVRRSPWLLVGWLWFLGTLVPVIGLVQLGSAAMADRYTYWPSVGLFLAGSWELARRIDPASRQQRRLAAAAVAALLVGLAGQTWRQIGFWRDQETLFRHAIAVTGENGQARLVLSQELAFQGRFAEALPEAQEAARLQPGYARAHKNLGFVLLKLGRTDEAIEALRRAISLQPGFAEAHGNLAIAYGRKGWHDAAYREMALERELRGARP